MMKRSRLSLAIVLVWICAVLSAAGCNVTETKVLDPGRGSATLPASLPVGGTAAAGETQPAVTDQPAVTEQPAVIDQPAETAIPGTVQGAPTGQERPHYDIEVTLNYDAKQASVVETIRYPNQGGEALGEIQLAIEPAFYYGTFQLESISLADGMLLSGETWEGTRLKVPLPAPLSPGASLELKIQYQLLLPTPERSVETRPVPFGATARQTNLVDWYPYIPPYQPDSGWLAHDQGYFGEHTVYELADFDVRLKFENPRPNLTTAASAPAVQDGDWQVYHLEAGRNFAISVSDQYEVLQGKAGDVTVISYAFPFNQGSNQQVLDTTIQAVELYQELFGAYPRSQLSAIEANFLDGMEYEGLYFLSEGFYNLYTGTPAEYLTAIAAHETAHQWWYAGVANDQAMEPWLDEALCTYAERIYYERYYPDALSWWWGYRVDYYDPRGWVDGSIYNPEGYRAYRDAVYLNGAHFLEDLRTRIGDETFFAFLKDYTMENRGKIATSAVFFETLKRHSETDISDLVSQYFQKTYP